ncbi:MAG: hypothetical protein AB7D37_04445 [Desulfovibrio sp.]
MSFLGAVSAPVRQVLAGYAREIATPVRVVGAGNFTVPAALRAGGYAGEIHACDVSLYSCAFGAYLAGWPLKAWEREDCPDQLRGFLRPDSPMDLAASVALLLDLRQVWKAHNPYQVTVLGQYRQRWDSLLSGVRQRLAAFREQVSPIAFEARDGFAVLESAPRESTIIAFPPTYKKGYENLEKLLTAAVSWDRPDYREMTDKTLELYESIARFDGYFVVLEKDLPEVRAILGQPVAVLPRGRGKTTTILAKKASRKVVVRHVIKSADIGPVWPSSENIPVDARLTLGVLSPRQTIRFNELFLSSRIDYFEGGVALSLVFLVNGRAIGKADFCKSSQQWSLPGPGAMIYLMSDLAVPSAEPRLAKLVLLAILSRDVRELVDRKLLERHSFVGTTAFAKKPVSMKYRGVFKLHSRKEKEDGFALNYLGIFAAHDLAGALGLWRKKYANAAK